jgi:hypothetical protein
MVMVTARQVFARSGRLFTLREEFSHSRRFDPRLDASRPSRELAIQWADEERRALEAGGTPP